MAGPVSPLAKSVVEKYDKLKATRSVWERIWGDLKDLVRPDTSSFSSTATRSGMSNTDRLFDGTAPWSLEQLASGLHSYLTSPTDRWFGLTLKGVDPNSLTDSIRLWLELNSDIIYQEYARPTVNFNPMVHEMYLDIGAFGTSVMFEGYSFKTNSLMFRSIPLADAWVEENDEGIIDTLFRRIKWNLRQIEQQFGEIPPETRKDAEKQQGKEFEVIHAVFPRANRDTGKLTQTNMKFASIWVIKELKYVIRESGFMEFPYPTPRWTKVSGETYGRSPGMVCLPDIRMLNAMSKTLIKAAEKAVDPPLLVPDDGFMLPIKTAPASLIYHETGLQDELKPLISGGDPGLSLELMEQRREQIRRTFFTDWLIRQRKKERQTTVEIMDERNEMLQQLAPMLGRLQTEFMGPTIRRSIRLLDRAGRLVPPPPELEGAKIDIIYTSPAAKAQMSGKATVMQAYVQDIASLAQIDPTALDGIDFDAMAKELGKLRDVSQTIMRSDEQIMQLREQRQMKEQQQELLTGGVEAAKATKDFAMAEKALGGSR